MNSTVLLVIFSTRRRHSRLELDRLTAQRWGGQRSERGRLVQWVAVPAEAVSVSVAVLVEHGDCCACQYEFDDCVAADVSHSARHQYALASQLARVLGAH